MASGKEHAAMHGSVATGHGSKNRGHRGIAGVHATSSRPRTGPVDVVGEVAAMAGGKELHGALENAHTSHHIPREKVGER